MVIIGIGFLSVAPTWINMGNIMAKESKDPSNHHGMYGISVWKMMIEMKKKKKNAALIE